MRYASRNSPDAASRCAFAKAVTSKPWWPLHVPVYSQYGPALSVHASDVNGRASILYWSSRSIAGWIGQNETSAGLAASICSPGAHAIVQKTSRNAV